MVEVVVIGAGPFGLSVAAHLRGRRVPYRVFGKTMSMWQDHTPKGLTLKSDGFASNLSTPGEEYPLERFYREIGRTDYAHVGHRIAADTLAAYGHEFQRRYVGDVQDSQVVALDRADGGFRMVLDSGEEVAARRVVVATGLLSLRNVPEIFSSLPSTMLSHSSAHHDLSGFKGRRVIVVGAGQSACEMSALLNEQGAEVTMLTRRPLRWFDPAKEDDPTVYRGLLKRVRRPNFGLGPGWRTWFWSEMPYAFTYLPEQTRYRRGFKMFPPAGSGWIKHRVEGVVPIYTGSLRSIEATAREVSLSVETAQGITDLSADHVIAATGYRPDMHRLPFLKALHGEVRTLSGVPILNRAFESSVPGLYFVGFLSSGMFGPSMRFIYGARFTAGQISRHVSHLRDGMHRSERFTVRTPLQAGAST